MSRTSVAGGGRPFGDIFQVNTPNIDALGQHLYQQEQVKKQQEYQENKALDDNFTKELANVKKADIPDIVQSWNDFKQGSIGVLKKGSQATPQDHYDLLQKRADVMQKINASTEEKNRVKELTQAKKSDNKGLFVPDAYQRLSQRLNTPTSQINQDTADGELMNKYSVPDLGDIEKASKGTSVQTRIPTGKVSSSDPMKDVVEYYNKGNTPNEYFNTFLGRLVTSKNAGDQDNFAGVMNNKYSDQELDKLKSAYYAKVTDPNFIKLYGETKPFNEMALQTNSGKASAIKTMEYFTSLPTTPTTTKEEINVDRQTKNRQAFQKAQMAQGNLNTLSHIRLAAGLRKDEKDDDAAVSADAVLHNLHDIISSGKPTEDATTPWGMSKSVVEISDPNLLKTFSAIVKDGTTPIPPDNIYFNKETNQGVLKYKLTDGTIKEIPISGADMAKAKAKETYTGANAGKVVVVIDKVVTKNNGLTNTLKMYEPNQKESTPAPSKSSDNDVIKIKFNGKVLQGRKGDLKKLDDAKIKYEIIK